MQEKYCLGVPSDITIFRKLVENGSYIDKTMYLRRIATWRSLLHALSAAWLGKDTDLFNAEGAFRRE